MVEGTVLDQWHSPIRHLQKLLFEIVSNPTLEVIDIAAV